MKKMKLLPIGVAILTTIALPIFAQEGAKRATKARAVAENAPMDSLVKKQLNLVLGYLGERVAQQADLSSDELSQLQEALYASVEQSMTDDESIRQDWSIAAHTGTASTSDFLEKTLSYPAPRAALIAHLSKDQIQQYVTEAQSRNHRKRLALASQIVATVDPHLSFSAEQRKELTDTIATDPKLGINKSPVARSLTIEVMMRIDPNTMLQMIPQPVRQQIRDSLTPKQAAAWELLLPGKKRARKAKEENDGDRKEQWLAEQQKLEKAILEGEIAPDEAGKKMQAMEEENWGKKKKQGALNKGEKDWAPDKEKFREKADPREARFNAAVGDIKALEAAGRITEEESDRRMTELKRRIFAEEFDPTVAKGSASDHRRDLIVATLAAHTEQLGELDARASKRLELVSKGVVVQHMESLEAREQASEGADARLEQEMRAIREAIGAGRLTREQAAERMEGLRRQMAATMRRVPPSTLASGITNHPLYQKTIQDVLSEDAFGAYQAHRAKRESFRQQAVRNLVVANLDGQMLFDSAQQKDVQQISSVIEVVAEAPAYRVLSRVVEGLDKDNLSDWQREVFDSMLDD